MMLCNCKNFFQEDESAVGVIHKCKICGRKGLLIPEMAHTKPDTIREIRGDSEDGVSAAKME